jgi:signal peptidase I
MAFFLFADKIADGSFPVERLMRLNDANLTLSVFGESRSGNTTRIGVRASFSGTFSATYDIVLATQYFNSRGVVIPYADIAPSGFWSGFTNFFSSAGEYLVWDIEGLSGGILSDDGNNDNNDDDLTESRIKNIVINGRNLISSHPPLEDRHGNVYVPLIDVAEAFGAFVEVINPIIITHAGIRNQLSVGSNIKLVTTEDYTDSPMSMSTAVVNSSDGTLYIGIESISTILKSNVNGLRYSDTAVIHPNQLEYRRNPIDFVIIDGQRITMSPPISSILVDGYNYVHLRDLSYVFSYATIRPEKRFTIGGFLDVTEGDKKYTIVDFEMNQPPKPRVPPLVNPDERWNTVFPTINGESQYYLHNGELRLRAFPSVNIFGANHIRLRYIGQHISNASIRWDGAASAIYIDTGFEYNGLPEIPATRARKAIGDELSENFAVPDSAFIGDEIWFYVYWENAHYYGYEIRFFDEPGTAGELIYRSERWRTYNDERSPIAFKINFEREGIYRIIPRGYDINADSRNGRYADIVVSEKRENYKMNNYLDSIGGQPAIDWNTNSTGTQCPDLIMHYVETVWGITTRNKAIYGAGGRHNFMEYPRHHPDYFERIDYYDGFIPQRGDIISLRGSASNARAYGHVAIVRNVSGNTVTVVDQWRGSGTVHVQTFNLNNVGQAWTTANAISPSSWDIYGVARPKK